MYYSALQCVAVSYSIVNHEGVPQHAEEAQCVAGCCRVLQSIAGCRRELQRVALCCSVLQGAAVRCSVLQYAQCAVKRFL